MRGAGGPDRGGEEAGEAPGRSSGASALSGRRGGRRAGRQAGRQAGGQGPPAPLLSWGCTAPSPAAAASPRRPRSPLPARSLRQKGCEGSSPAAPPAAPYRQQIATANKAEIPGAGSPAGIKAPSGACSNRTGSDVRCPRLRRHLRPSPCPPARPLLGFVRAGRSKGGEAEKSFLGPVGAAGFGGAGSWRRLPFVVSFIHKS